MFPCYVNLPAVRRVVFIFGNVKDLIHKDQRLYVLDLHVLTCGIFVRYVSAVDGVTRDLSRNRRRRHDHARDFLKDLLKLFVICRGKILRRIE